MDNTQTSKEVIEKQKKDILRYSNLALALIHITIFYWAISQARNDANAYIYGVKTFNTITAEIPSQAEFYATFMNLSTIDAVSSTFLAAPYYNALSALDNRMKNFNNDGYCYTRPDAQVVGWSYSEYYYRAADNRKLDKVSKWWILTFMIIVTVAAHLMRFFFFSGVYAMILNNQPRWDRWVEYSISSPLMIVLVAYTTGTIESGTLLILAASQVVLVIVGLAIELSFWQASIEKDKTILPFDVESKDTQSSYVSDTSDQGPMQRQVQPIKMTIRTPFEMSNKSYFYTKLATPKSVREENNLDPLPPFTLKLYGVIFLIVTWFVFILQWTVIFWNLNDLLGIFHCMNHKNYSRKSSIPIMIAIFEFILFMFFGVVATVGASVGHYRNNGKRMAYAYDILSLASKAILMILLIVEASEFKVRSQ